MLMETLTHRGFMKLFLIFLFLVVATREAFSATCTNTTRTNYSTGQVLTSSALNADLNQLVTKLNAFDGGCTTSGTLEFDALNTSNFGAMLNGITEGCKVSRSDSNTLSVGKCIASVNGNLIKTSSANTVTWGCSGCAGEASSSTFYVYAKTGSTGTTLDLLISSTAPGEDGYDVSSNKVLGSFYNDSSNNIATGGIHQWVKNSMEGIKVAFIEDAKAANTAGGTFTAGAWRTRDLNLVRGDTSIVTLASNQFTIGPGEWLIEATAPGYLVNANIVKIRNVTDSTDLAIGTVETTSSSYFTQTRSKVVARVNLTTSKTYEIQHRGATTQATNGFGNPGNLGENEVYTQVILTQLAR